MKLQKLTTAILLGFTTLLLALGCETDSSSDDSSSSDDNPSPKTAITGTFDYLDGNRARFLKGSTVSNIAPKWKNTAENQEANLTYSVIQTLPGTLTINSNTGVISGNAPADASAPVQYTIRATGKGDFTGTKTFGITIIIVESTITYSPIAEGTAGISTPSFVAGTNAADGTFSILASGIGNTGTVTATVPTIDTDNGDITVTTTTTAGTYMVTFTKTSDTTEEIGHFYVTTTPTSVADIETVLEIGIGHFGLVADFNYIQTGALTSMYGLFSPNFVDENNAPSGKLYIKGFNGDISKWDVSNVKTMGNMFQTASKFTGDISGWNVENVTAMESMFRGASEFNRDLSGWNVENVINMGSMFQDAREFNVDISGWTVDNVISMGYMFHQTREFNVDISGWNVENVQSMGGMFGFAEKFNADISGWTVDNVKYMEGMFRGASEFNRDLSGWNVENVINMGSMFQDANVFDGDISGWTVNNVQDMESMFNGASEFNRDLSGWNVEKVANIGGMFYYASAFDQNLEDWGEHFTLDATTKKATHTGADATIELKKVNTFPGSKLVGKEPSWY